MKRIQQAGGIIINPNGEIALVTNLTGSQTFPKGAQEAGESLEDTARREIAEETGLTDIAIGEELGVIERPGYTAKNRQTPSVVKVIHIYRCSTNSTEPLQPQLNDIRAAHWAPIPSVADILTYAEEVTFFTSVQHKLTPR